MKKKILCFALALVMCLCLAACGDNGDDTSKAGDASNTESTASGTESAADASKAESTDAESSDAGSEDNSEVAAGPYEDLDWATLDAGEYDAACKAVYERALGEFDSVYEAGRNEVEDIGLRWALMAIAEAKLLESGVMVPTGTQGGMYAMSHAATRTITSVLWGSDTSRYHNAIVANELIKKEDQDAMKAKWTELIGKDGTEYDAFVKQYLADKGYTLNDTYAMAYAGDPVTWDVLATSQAQDSDAIVNTYDGLAEYDVLNKLQPALAESWEVSEDGTVYTFHIRKGVKWVDYQGREIADVKADDWVAGLQHACDSHGGLEYLLEGVVVNYSEYINGDITDFSEVGVKAVDDYTLQYTLLGKTPYFETMLGYSIFAPLCRSYYESQGGAWGVDEYNASENYQYGIDYQHIAYCGPYLVTNATASTTIRFEANPTYWNKDNINIKTITWSYNDSTDPTRNYEECKAGKVVSASFNANVLPLARDQKPEGEDKTYFDLYSYTSATTATTYSGFYNLNRKAFANVNDETKCVSTQSAEEQARTRTAINNQHFRLAISMGVDRATYNAAQTGEELKLNSLRNSYTPGNFVTLPNEATVEINGESKTYPAGTFFGRIVQDQIDADGIKIKVWDDELQSSDGFDGWYNVENAKEEFAKAVAELAEVGVEVSKENPIHLDLPYPSSVQIYTDRANTWKQSVEAALDGAVVVDLVDSVDIKTWQYCGYVTATGDQSNYNIYDLSGWSPDYGDPQTYLDTFLPDYAGYMAKCIGLF